MALLMVCVPAMSGVSLEMEGLANGSFQSSTTLAILTAVAIFSDSTLVRATNSAGVLAMSSAPTLASVC